MDYPWLEAQTMMSKFFGKDGLFKHKPEGDGRARSIVERTDIVNPVERDGNLSARFVYFYDVERRSPDGTITNEIWRLGLYWTHRSPLNVTVPYRVTETEHFHMLLDQHWTAFKTRVAAEWHRVVRDDGMVAINDCDVRWCMDPDVPQFKTRVFSVGVGYDTVTVPVPARLDEWQKFLQAEKA